MLCQISKELRIKVKPVSSRTTTREYYDGIYLLHQDGLAMVVARVSTLWFRL